MSELRDQYFAALKIGKSDTLKRERVLNRAYALLTFEIEHYWKRATYFWGFQIAIFPAFAIHWKGQAGSGWEVITLAGRARRADGRRQCALGVRFEIPAGQLGAPHRHA